MRIQRVQLLARLESHSLPRRNAYLGAGPRVAPDPRLPRPNAENAKSAQLNPVACSQGLLQSFKYRVNCCFGLRSRQAGALNNVMDEILLDQWMPLGLKKS